MCGILLVVSNPVGKDNLMGEIEYLLDVLPDIVSRLRSLSPTWPERRIAEAGTAAE